MAYVIEVNKRDVSPYAETCEYEGQEDHECDGDCRWLDGDLREIRDHGKSEYEYDPRDADLYGPPVQWATECLAGSSFPALHPSSSPVEDATREHEWLHGASPDPYKDEETEYSVYLRGDWTPEERAQVFRAVGY